MNPQIAESELEILNVIWNTTQPVTSSYIIKNLPKNIHWKRTTVLTLLKRLTEKGILSVEKENRVLYYSSNICQDEYKNAKTNDFIQKIHGGKLSSLIAALSSNDEFTPEEINKLKKLLLEENAYD